MGAIADVFDADFEIQLSLLSEASRYWGTNWVGRCVGFGFDESIVPAMVGALEDSDKSVRHAEVWRQATPCSVSMSPNAPVRRVFFAVCKRGRPSFACLFSMLNHLLPELLSNVMKTVFDHGSDRGLLAIGFSLKTDSASGVASESGQPCLFESPHQPS
jgi:hypothetical protein